jgi:hypothetical protein
MSAGKQFTDVSEGRSTSTFRVKNPLGLIYREYGGITLLWNVSAYSPQLNLPEDLNLCTTSPLERTLSQTRIVKLSLESKTTYSHYTYTNTLCGYSERISNIKAADRHNYHSNPKG